MQAAKAASFTYWYYVGSNPTPCTMSRTKYTKELLSDVIAKSSSFAEVLRRLDLKGGGAQTHIRQLAEQYGIDFSHFPLKRTIDQISSNEKSYINTHYLKERLWKSGLKQKQCEICGLTEWCGQPAPLCLDHIDGNNRNNAIDNLRILCHNCHAQTSTYGGKNIKRLPA